jgi:hypothetical protein
MSTIWPASLRPLISETEIVIEMDTNGSHSSGSERRALEECVVIQFGAYAVATCLN